MKTKKQKIEKKTANASKPKVLSWKENLISLIIRLLSKINKINIIKVKIKNLELAFKFILSSTKPSKKIAKQAITK